MTLLLCEINPAAQDDLLALGFQWGQSRVIAAARAEYAKLAAGGTRINTPKSVNTTRSAAIYNMAGEQLNDNPNTGVYIQNGKKYIKKAE
jgi:hypothetical protein